MAFKQDTLQLPPALWPRQTNRYYAPRPRFPRTRAVLIILCRPRNERALVLVFPPRASPRRIILIIWDRCTLLDIHPRELLFFLFHLSFGWRNNGLHSNLSAAFTASSIVSNRHQPSCRFLVAPPMLKPNSPRPSPQPRTPTSATSPRLTESGFANRPLTQMQANKTGIRSA